MKRKLWLILTGAFVVAIILCLFLSRTMIYAKIPRVEAGTFAEGSLRKTYTINGTYLALDAQNVSIASDYVYSAVVQEACVQAGEMVKEDQVLYRCKPSAEILDEMKNAKAALDEARLQLVQEQGDEELYAAYMEYIELEDAKYTAPADEPIDTMLAEAKEKLAVMVGDEDSQKQLEQLRKRIRRLEQSEELYLQIQSIVQEMEEVKAPISGLLVSMSFQNGDVLHTGDICAVISDAEEMTADFPLTGEQAAFYMSRLSLEDCRVRVGNATVSVQEPQLITTGAKPCLRCTAPYNNALYGINAVLELEFLTVGGILLPRSAVETVSERTVAFYIISQREGFFGKEHYVQRKEAVLLDWDADHVMIRTDMSLGTTLVLASSQPLADECTVLVIN